MRKALANFNNTSMDGVRDRHGWTLARRQEKSDGPKEMLLAMPLLLSTSADAKGLDTQSAEAGDSDIYSQPARDGNKDEFWVMIPPGGTLQLKIRSGACAETPVSLGSAGGIVSPTTAEAPQRPKWPLIVALIATAAALFALFRKTKRQSPAP